MQVLSVVEMSIRNIFTTYLKISKDICYGHTPQVPSLIETYFDSLDKYDSLITTNRIKSFVFDENFKSINFDIKKDGWVSTQTLKKLYEINSGAFSISIENMVKFNNRVGQKPYFYETDLIKSVDIDEEEEFKIAEEIYDKIIKDKTTLQ